MLFQFKENNQLVFVIAGPTTSGKTQLAIDLAKKHKGIVINADSQQVYKGLPILSCQPNKGDYKNVSHKLFNFLDVYKNFSVQEWFLLVEKEIINAKRKKKIPIIVGGTGMYLKALLEGLIVLPNIPKSIREKGRILMKNLGSKEFYKKLKTKNYNCVSGIDQNDQTRLLRSWEIYQVSKKSIYELRKENKRKKINSLFFFKILILPSRKNVYLNCIKRWKKILKLGAVNEVKEIIKKEKDLNKKAFLKTIGFAELRDYLRKKISLEDATNISVRATKNYAKRQYTWFKHQFSANIIFKIEYDKSKKEFFFKEIRDKLLTN